jgi:hypothetical protein
VPFIVRSKRAEPSVQSGGCAQCGEDNYILFHYTWEGGVKAHHVVNKSRGALPREKDLSKEQDFTPQAFCGTGCLGLWKDKQDKITGRASTTKGLYSR